MHGADMRESRGLAQTLWKALGHRSAMSSVFSRNEASSYDFLLA
jgi:hypothetical protein